MQIDYNPGVKILCFILFAYSRMSLKDKTKLQLKKFDVGDKFSHLPLAKASVLVPLMIRDGKLCVLFTVRSMKVCKFKAQNKLNGF